MVRRSGRDNPSVLPPIEFPEALPVSARRDEIAAALRDAPGRSIVCGETGSGKTTQLPKIALAMGRGRANGGGLIGHTQPRRIAASSVARRIAEELKTPLGEVVGFKVRFQDRLTAGASVKLMTDGILLAETQSDPLLRAYDTIIVDEAHERSLNIDFLLGHLRQILPRRPDLKIIVTSATIDADRFASHFAAKDGPAPVLQVSGRLYPVEIRWRPFEESRDHDLGDAICDAVDELWRGTLGSGEGGVAAAGSGDVLVFLPGEREIRDAAEKLRKHHPPGVEVLPLFSRLSQEQQDEVFAPHSARRIVLATNVAETSLTVPGIRYVIDAGTARIKRYSFRSKVEQLPIEPVSQAAANQRAGRCGRVADGICIRLYDEADFAGRPKFTEPEIVRSSLAGVILRMKSLNLGAVEDFPFLEAPPKRAIADGYQLLNELGATDDDNALTTIGRELAKLPLDPRVGRMILAAREREALREVLVIASSLSVQDVRDRPLEHQQAADQAHVKFDDEKSEFLGILKLWSWLESSRGGHGEHRLSSRKHEQVLRDNFVSPRRVREWRDVFAQLQQVVTEHGWRVNTTPATYEQLHLSMLAGLLGNIGLKSDEDDSYLGARGIRFHRHPGSHLSKKPGRWIVAAELVETTRLYARGIANIDPRWLETVGGHLLKKQLLEPHWEKKAGQVVALGARDALRPGRLQQPAGRLRHGRSGRGARALHPRGAGRGRLGDQAAVRRRQPQADRPGRGAGAQGAAPGRAGGRRADPRVLRPAGAEGRARRPHLRALVPRRGAAPAEPAAADARGADAPRGRGHHHPGVPADDAPRRHRLRRELSARAGQPARRRHRHRAAVCAQCRERGPLRMAGARHAEGQGGGAGEDPAAAAALAPRAAAGLRRGLHRPAFRSAKAACWTCSPPTCGRRAASRCGAPTSSTSSWPPHLLMNLRVVDEHGRQLGESRHLAELKAQLGGAGALGLPGAGGAAPAGSDRRGAGGADGGARPAVTPDASAGGPSATPATAVASRDLPARCKPGLVVRRPRHFHRLDLRRAAGADGSEEGRTGADRLPGADRQGRRTSRSRCSTSPRRPPTSIASACAACSRCSCAMRSSISRRTCPTCRGWRSSTCRSAAPRSCASRSSPSRSTAPSSPSRCPADAAAFARRLEEGRGRLTLIAGEVARAAGAVLAEWVAAQKKLKDARPPRDVADDIAAQLERLVPKRFLVETPWVRLAHLPRYLKAIVLRLDKLRADPARDASRLAELRPLEQRHLRKLAERRGSRDPKLDEFRWWLEELRVSLFAQELKTPQPVSAKRLEKIWAQAFA